MSNRKNRITQKLVAAGAAWAVTDQKTVLPEDRWFAKPTYHIHPDRKYPHVDSILTFSSLAEIEEWLKHGGDNWETHGV